MNRFCILFLFFILFINIGTSKPNSITIKSCKNLIKALDLNTGAYNKCLFSNLGEKYTAEELKACQAHYLNEVERLSYVYKNICK